MPARMHPSMSLPMPRQCPVPFTPCTLVTTGFFGYKGGAAQIMQQT